MIFKTKIYLIVLVGYLALSSKVYAYDASVGLGNLSEFIGKIQTDDQGNSAIISLNPYLKLNIDFIYDAKNPNHIINSEIGLTIPKSDPDPNTHRLKFFGLLNYKYQLESLYTKIGLGLFFTRVWANDGEEELNNGSSTTSFPLPDKATVSRNAIVNLALGHSITTNLNAEIQSMIFNLTNNEDRAFSVGVCLNYQLGEIW
jgi:hypothetical protein